MKDNKEPNNKENKEGIYADHYIDYDLDKVISENYSYIPRID